MENKKRRKFRPCKQWRYLPGDVELLTNQNDLYWFNTHRLRVYNCKPVVDDKPFTMNPYKVMPFSTLKNAMDTANQIDRENKVLMNKINYIHRNGGRVETYNAGAFKVMKLNWGGHIAFMKSIVVENQVIYNMIKKARPVIDRNEFDETFDNHKKWLKKLCKYEICIGKKPDYDLILSRQPSISFGLDKEKEPARPQCFLEFKVRDGPYLGKIYIELYQDFVPVTCQNFMEICKGEGRLSYKGCVLHRIVKGKFIETGDITHNNGRGGESIYGKTFPEEKHVLKHTRAGIVSMKRVIYTENNSQFIITLTEMEQWDRMHVVFGKVVKGNGVLFKIEDYGRKIGKPYADVLICNCGVIEAKREEQEVED